jgi:hypothetical protein
MLGAPPLAFGFAIHALRRAADRWPSYFAVVLCGLELAAWLFLWISLVVSSLD